MRESYDEGLATHIGPELCVVFREGFGEELVGVHVGRPLSRETTLKSWVPTGFDSSEGNTGWIVKCEIQPDPARSETPRMHVKHLTRAQGSLVPSRTHGMRDAGKSLRAHSPDERRRDG